MVCEPLELEYLAAGLNGDDVRILDLILEDGLERRLSEFRPHLVATSCYITGVNEAIKVCRTVKRWNRDCLTVTGGVHASVAPEDFADTSVDAIALGDGTSVISALVEAAAGKRLLSSIPNLALPSGPGRVVRTPVTDYMPDPDSLPLPRRDLTAHLRDRYYYLFHQPVALMKTTWGCPHNCAFCMTWRITGGRPFSRSPQSVVGELEQIREEEIYIVDDIFLMDPPRLAEIAQLIRERNIRKRFLVYGRADFIAEHPEIIGEWADLGLTAVIVGLEATTDAELQSLEKRCTVDDNREAVRVLRDFGVDIYASLIPRPDYTRSDWDRMFEFIEQNELYYVNISPLTPMPGSPIWREHENRVCVDRSAHGLWDLTHCVLPTREPLKTFYRNLLRLYARTVLNIGRANRLTLRTRPPIWSFKYLRLWWGAVRIFCQFLRAHRHHSPAEMAVAMDRGPDVNGLEFRAGDNAASTTTIHTGTSTDPGDSPMEPDRALRPSHQFGDFFDPGSRQPPHHQLLDIPNARRWFNLLGWGVPTDLYTLQQAAQGKSGIEISVGGQRYLTVSSYDYLGLIGHPEIERAAIEATQKYGTGTGGVRLLTGSTDLHQQLDRELAVFKGTESCLTFSSGYLANLAVISALLRPDDVAIIDSRVHRSVVDGCRLARVRVRRFAHNDCNSLEEELRAAAGGHRRLIVVEGVYSMDGDLCPLPEIVALKHRYGASLMVDEAHSFGVLGDTGRGVNEHFGLSTGEVDLWMGTLSKAIPSTGGFVAARRDLVIYLQHGAAPYMFSAAGNPVSVAAASAGLRILQREPERLSKVRDNSAYLRQGLNKLGFNTGTSDSHIVPVIIGSNRETIVMSGELFKRGLIAPAIGTPAVMAGQARLRLCGTALQDKPLLDRVLQIMEAARDAVRASRTEEDGIG